jgi:hypothetical protein
MDAFEADAKIALLATLDSAKLPHLTLLTSLQAKSPRTLMFGQFCEGASKTNLRRDPHAAFLVLDARKRVWRGTASWTGEASQGDDYEAYNRKPMFRYNAYAGIHKVHYLDIVELSGIETLPAVRTALGSLVMRTAGAPAKSRWREGALKAWAIRHFDSVRTLKFGAVVGDDGYPRIHFALRCATYGPSRLMLAPGAFGADLKKIEDGAAVAIFALNLNLESVLVRGRFAGYRRAFGTRAATLEMDWVYNSMPFKHGQIFPSQPLRAVHTLAPADFHA